MKSPTGSEAGLLIVLVFSLVAAVHLTPLSCAEGGAEKRVSISAVKEDITVVLNRLAGEMGLNIVIGKEVTGVVTADLKNVPALAALNLVVKMNGYDYRILDGTIIVGAEQTLAKFPPGSMAAGGEKVTRVLRLRYSDPKDISSLLKQIYPQAQIIEDVKSRALIVTTDKSTLKRMINLIYGDSKPPGE
ncbi:MAG: secretin N-terminal domain-containing protein [Candidatus Xenobiia bacterium LiM19]